MRRLVHEGIRELVPYPPGKPIEELERELGIHGSIKLASNENPLGPSPEAVKAIKNSISSLNRYPDGSAYYMKEALSKKYGISPEEIIVGNGSDELLELIIRTFFVYGDHAVQSFPTFLVYEKIIMGAGGDISSVPLSNFGLDLERMLDAVTSKTRVIFINNPNNPTGSVLFKDELLDFLHQVPDDIIVVLDEAYIEFVRDDRVANGLELITQHPLLIVLRTFSKLYGLAGLRIGYGFASREVVDYMNRIRQPFNVNSLAQAAAVAALTDSAFVSRTIELTNSGLEYLFRELDNIGIEYHPTQTNFFLIKVPGGGDSMYNKMLKHGVIVRSMSPYGLSDYIRINVGLPEENERFIETFRKVLDK